MRHNDLFKSEQASVKNFSSPPSVSAWTQSSEKVFLPTLEAELDAMKNERERRPPSPPRLTFTGPQSIGSDLNEKSSQLSFDSFSRDEVIAYQDPKGQEIPSTPQIHISSDETGPNPFTDTMGKTGHRISRFFSISRRKPRQVSSYDTVTELATNADIPQTKPLTEDEWEKQAESLALSEPSTSPSATAKKSSRLSAFANTGFSLRKPSDISVATSSGSGTNDPLLQEASPALLSPTSPSIPGGSNKLIQNHQPKQTAQKLAVTFSKSTDKRLQEAIDLHEAGNLEQSAVLFEKLADPESINHPLAQVLCGLSYRHGWGVQANEERAFQYLKFAAGNSALVDQILSTNDGAVNNMAIKPSPNNLSKRGVARGELVLSIYELGNCFRYGWGTPKDPVLAKQYYETAARLGDLDAISETAWCYLTGFGMKKKDKYTAAQYYRMAEKAGKVEVGNSWIW